MSTARHVSLFNRALVLLGEEPIATAQGTSSVQVAVETLYPFTVEDLLGRYRWRFAAEIRELQRSADAPLGRYDAAYILPNGYDEVVDALFIGGTVSAYERFGQLIHCNAGENDTVTAELRRKPHEAEWPIYFETAVAAQLAADLAIPLTEDTQRATIMQRRADMAYNNATGQDAQSRSARKMPVGRLRAMHRGRP